MVTPPDGSFTYTFWRLATMTWGGGSCTGNYSWAEWYSYTQGGLVLKKRLRVTRADSPASAIWTGPIRTTMKAR
ncbi:MAG: hypothetical protein ACKV22_25100 [Bryobacteraceae bacterium]